MQAVADEAIQRALEEARAAGVRAVTFVGGEPAIDPRLPAQALQRHKIAHLDRRGRLGVRLLLRGVIAVGAGAVREHGRGELFGELPPQTRHAQRRIPRDLLRDGLVLDRPHRLAQLKLEVFEQLRQLAFELAGQLLLLGSSFGLEPLAL